ncbi:hypothetical protein E2P81_ATG08137 [Venturia nashicola]|nr:hypothetical protein E2P81_ATG08137 [Venturia nashicola]
MTQSGGKRRRQDEFREELPLIVVQTETALKRGLSTVEEEEEGDSLDSLYIKEPSRGAKKAKGKAAKETKFEATVQSDRDELRGHLSDLVKKAEETDTQFRKQMKAYLTSLGIPVSNTKEPRQQDDFNKMLATASRLMKASKQLDQDYSVMIATAESVQKELKREDDMNTFTEDKNAAVQLLEKGLRLSMKRIDQLIPEGAKAGKLANSIDISSDLSYNEVSAFFQNTHPEEKRLRETLVQTTKGVKRIVRFLPEDEI